MNYVVTACLLVIIVSALLGIVRFIKGPNHSDRIIVFDLLASLLLTGCALMTIYFKDAIWLDVALVIALVAFVGTVGMAYFLRRIGEP